MKKNQTNRSELPKGAYRLPTGNYITKSSGVISGRRITITAVYKDPPDYKLLAQALLQAAAQKRYHEKR